METESKSNFFGKLFLFIVYGGLIFTIYIYFNKSPCDKPVTYSIGRVDNQFGISKSDVEKYTNDANNVWNVALNKNLLKKATSSKITINFIFDERQRNTIQTAKAKASIADQKQNLDQLKNTIDNLKAEYDSKLVSYNTQKSSYEKDLANYNNSVDYWNSRGGAPSDVYNDLNRQKINLENNYNLLNQSVNELQNLVTQMNTYSDTHNNLANNVNQVIEKINQNAGREFEEGVYDPNKKTITIYEYESITGLKRVLAHELGHALGIDHVSNKDSIMYYLNNSKNLKPTPEDVSALQKICKSNILFN